MSGETIAPERLAEIAGQVFGPRWQLPLARALGYAPRHVRYWAAGARPIPAEVEARLTGWVFSEINRLSRVAARIAGRRGRR